jgi:hypothetical protein
MNHNVITLHEGGRADGAESAFASFYDIAYHHQFGAGVVVLLRVPSLGVDAVFTDRLDLGRAWQARLRGMGNTDAMLARDPVVVTGLFRDPWIDDWFGYRLRAAGVEIALRWEDLDTPFYAEGPNGGFSPTEDIWSLFVGARSASVIVNGAAAPGAPFDDDVWVPKLGRSVSSAHGAFAETRITPVAG